jgi:hypothetical protein
VNSLRWLRSEDEPRARRIVASAAIVAAGVILITVGAIADWGWTRIVGAAVITIAGAYLGVLIGFIGPQRALMRAAFNGNRTLIAVIVGVVLVLPVVVALCAAFVGLIARSSASAGLVSLGTLVALVLLVATLFSTVVALRATARALHRRDTADAEATGATP